MKVLSLVVFLCTTLSAKLQWSPNITEFLKRLNSASYAIRNIGKFSDVAITRLVFIAVSTV